MLLTAVLSFFLLSQNISASDFTSDNQREAEKLLASLGKDFVGNLKTKYDQLFTNYASEIRGKSIEFYTTSDTSACGYPTDGAKRLLSSIEYNEKAMTNGWQESLKFVGCQRKNEFTIIIQRQGENLERLGIHSFMDSLEYLDLKETETQKTISFMQDGQRIYNIYIRKKDSEITYYTYEFDGSMLLNIKKINDAQQIRIDIAFPKIHVANNDPRDKRLWLVYDKKTKMTTYRWPKDRLSMSKKQYDSLIQQVVRGTLSYFYAALHEQNLLNLPDTKVVVTSVSDSEFYRRIVEILPILKSGQTIQTIDFLETTKKNIEEGVLVIDERH